MTIKANGQKVGAILNEVEHLGAKERVSLLRGLFRIPKVRKELENIDLEDEEEIDEATAKAILKARKQIKRGEFVRLEDLKRKLYQR